MTCRSCFLCPIFLLLLSGPLSGQLRAALDQKLADQARLPDGKERVTALIGLAYDYLQFNADSAAWFAREGLRVARRVGDGWGEATYYIWAATVQQRQGLPEAAMTNLDTALQITTVLRDTVLLAGIYQTKANIFIGKNEGYVALAYMDKAEQLAGRTTKGRLKTGIQIDKGRIQQAVGEIENAMTSYQNAIHLADSMGRTDLLANAYANMGALFVFAEDEPKLREIAEKSLDFATKAGNPFLKAQAVYMLGTADALSHQYEPARQKLEEALALYREQNRESDAYRVALALVKVLTRLKQFDRAEALWMSLDSTLFADNIYEFQIYGLARAVMLEETGRLAEAEKWYKKNVESAEARQDRRSINQSYIELSGFYERRENYAAALSAARQAKQILSESGYVNSMRRAVEKEIEVRNEKDKALREKQVAVLESDKLRSDLLVEQQQKALLQTRLQTEQQQRKLTALEAQQLLQSCELESKEVSLREERLVREKKETEVGALQREKMLQSAQLRAERLYRILLAALSAAGLVLLYLFYRRLQRSRLLELRANIAQDLHDDLGSDMSGIALASYAAARSADPARMQQALHNIAGQSSRLVDDLRDIVWSIHPDNDSLEKITARMRQHAARLLEEQDVSVRFHMAPNTLALKMQPEARKHLYLFFKEAIHNIARHARCTSVEVDIRREKNAFILDIRDNGQGFDPAAPPASNGGNGLRHLHQRAEVLGGRLEVKSQTGGGTALRLEAPLF